MRILTAPHGQDRRFILAFRSEVNSAAQPLSAGSGEKLTSARSLHFPPTYQADSYYLACNSWWECSRRQHDWKLQWIRAALTEPSKALREGSVSCPTKLSVLVMKAFEIISAGVTINICEDAQGGRCRVLTSEGAALSPRATTWKEQETKACAHISSLHIQSK